MARANPGSSHLSRIDGAECVQGTDRIALARDLPEQGLKAGDIGVFVDANGPNGPFIVEFVAFGGETIAIVDLPVGSIRALRNREIASAREVA